MKKFITILAIIYICNGSLICMEGQQDGHKQDPAVFGQFLIEESQDINMALMTAVETNHNDAAKWIIDRGADINMTLVMAVLSGVAVVCQWLIENGADLSKALVIAEGLDLQNVCEGLIEMGACKDRMPLQNNQLQERPTNALQRKAENTQRSSSSEETYNNSSNMERQQGDQQEDPAVLGQLCNWSLVCMGAAR